MYQTRSIIKSSRNPQTAEAIIIVRVSMPPVSFNDENEAVGGEVGVPEEVVATPLGVGIGINAVGAGNCGATVGGGGVGVGRLSLKGITVVVPGNDIMSMAMRI
jgi:hypothetical protein